VKDFFKNTQVEEVPI
jgi:AdoMet-dependent rRNA methyltransferase SPB1